MDIFLVVLYNLDDEEESVSAIVIAECFREAKRAAVEECSFNVDDDRTECTLIDDVDPRVIWCS